MTVEFIGYAGHNNSSETFARKTGAIDPAFVETVAKAHDYYGFDRVLVAFFSSSPDSLVVAQHVASVTRSLGLMVAHRPGFTAPTLAARQFATLDQFCKGRVAVHFITGGNDTELAQDGDYLTKDERYARTNEYIEVVRQEWTSPTPFDYTGKYYRVTRAFGDVKPWRDTGIPIYFGGVSDAALPVGAKHADVYALWGETHEQTREMLARVRTAAAALGRAPRFSLSFRPVLSDTEEQAWAKADAILERAKTLRQATAGRSPLRHGMADNQGPPNEGSRRLLAAAAKGPRLDKCLWTGMAALTGAPGNTTGLVGTPDQVADAMMDYYDMGISTFLIRGFDPLADAVQYGSELLPRVRELVKARDAENAKRQAVA